MNRNRPWKEKNQQLIILKKMKNYYNILLTIKWFGVDQSWQILQNKNVSKFLIYCELFKNWFGRTNVVSR